MTSVSVSQVSQWAYYVHLFPATHVLKSFPLLVLLQHQTIWINSSLSFGASLNIAVKYLTGQHVPTTCLTILFKPKLYPLWDLSTTCVFVFVLQHVFFSDTPKEQVFSVLLLESICSSPDMHPSTLVCPRLPKQYQCPFVEGMVFVDSGPFWREETPQLGPKKSCIARSISTSCPASCSWIQARTKEKPTMEKHIKP